jgi:hypothetical protein
MTTPIKVIIKLHVIGLSVNPNKLIAKPAVTMVTAA